MNVPGDSIGATSSNLMMKGAETNDTALRFDSVLPVSEFQI